MTYRPEGGDAVGVYGGEKNGFNNPSGVAVGSDGHIYAVEQSMSVVQELGADGHFIRKYDPKCRPTHAVASGDWIDLSCDRGLASINVKDHSIQLSRFEPMSSRPGNATGITYGADKGIIFLLEGSTLRMYTIQH